MKILCLHGMGTNSKILEAQLSPFRQHFDQSHEFVFFDGEVECDPPPGIPAFFKGPFYCYYDKPTAESVSRAYDDLLDFIEEAGPFHGVIGFSQGASLAASLLLRQAKVSPKGDSLFNFAVLMISGIPWDLDFDRQLQPYHTTIDGDTGEISVRGYVYGDMLEETALNGFLVPSNDGDVVLRRYHPSKETARIEIPTVHVMGEMDFYLPQERMVLEFCSGPTEIVMHGGGHMLPRDTAFSRGLAAAIERAIALVKTQH